MESNKKNKSSEVLRQYLRNRYSVETEKKIQRWFIESPESIEKEKATKEFWDGLEISKSKEAYKALKNVNLKIGIYSKKRLSPYNIFWRVAAIFILLAGISGAWFYYNKLNNSEMLEVSTLYGETKQITLPDESVVWLNAGSQIKYPSNFSKKRRLVSLSGEAFFSVTKDESKPFIVEAGNLFVKVLGTKFNLRTYSDDDNIVATLQEGKIEIQTEDKQKKRLLPNEKLIYDRQTSKVEIVKISPDDIPDWKNGNLLFFDVTLGEIFQTLTRYFNIPIEVDKSINQSTEHYTIKFERGEDLEQVLQILEDVTSDFSYSSLDDKIVIKKK